MIQDYEVMLVLNPALNEDDNASARERVNELLTRSDGEIVSEDRSNCELKGKHFLVHGRAQHSEIRGCSDT